jgi:hypothetical protein
MHDWLNCLDALDSLDARAPAPATADD